MRIAGGLIQPILSPMEICREISSCGWQGCSPPAPDPPAARTPGRKSPARSCNGVESRSSGGRSLPPSFFLLASLHRDLVTATSVVERPKPVHDGLGGPNRTFSLFASQRSLLLDPSPTSKTCPSSSNSTQAPTTDPASYAATITTPLRKGLRTTVPARFFPTYTYNTE